MPIARIGGPLIIKDFTPINLLGCIYKLIAKVLVRRMTSVLDKVIGKSQHALVSGRQILDTALIVNEVVDELTFIKRDGVLCKVDMKKVYDYVSWGFLDVMLEMLGFRVKWRHWVRTCITTASFAVIVNGGASRFFQTSRGLR